MDALTLETKIDLKPWLTAHSAKTYVLIRFNQSDQDLMHLIGLLFSHFLPNLHAVFLIDPDLDVNSPGIQSLLELFGERVSLIQKQVGNQDGYHLLQGLHFALEHGAKKVIQLPGYSIKEVDYILEMLRLADQYDLVVGSRFQKKQVFFNPQQQFQYRLDRWLNSILIKFFRKSGMTDAFSKVRCWSTPALYLTVNHLRFGHPRLLNLEMTWLIQRLGLKIREFPIDYQPTLGNSS